MANLKPPKNQNILNNLNKFVKEELDKENIPADTKYAIVAGVNNDGVKILAAVNIHKTDKYNTKVAAIWEHDWDGNDIAGLKVIFTGK